MVKESREIMRVTKESTSSSGVEGKRGITCRSLHQYPRQQSPYSSANYHSQIMHLSRRGLKILSLSSSTTEEGSDFQFEVPLLGRRHTQGKPVEFRFKEVRRRRCGRSRPQIRNSGEGFGPMSQWRISQRQTKPPQICR